MRCSTSAATTTRPINAAGDVEQGIEIDLQRPGQRDSTSRLMVRCPVSMRLIVDALTLVRLDSSSRDRPSVVRKLRSRVRTTCSTSSRCAIARHLANIARRFAIWPRASYRRRHE